MREPWPESMTFKEEVYHSEEDKDDDEKSEKGEEEEQSEDKEDKDEEPEEEGEDVTEDEDTGFRLDLSESSEESEI